MPTNNFSHPSINNSGNHRVRYCRNCGAPLEDGANFCGRCGARYEAAQGQQQSNYNQSRATAPQNYTGGGNSGGSMGGGYVNNSYSGGNSGGAGYTYNARSGNVGDYSRLSVDPDAALNILLRKMKTSRTIWIVLSIYMIIVGIATAFAGYGFFPIGLAIWNLYQCSRNKKTAEQWEITPVGIVSAYETDKIVPVIMVFINLIFGAFFGMIGSIYNLSINHYVIDHKDAFYELERRAGRYV